MLSEKEIIKGITNIIYTCNEAIEDEEWHNQEEIESAKEQLKFTEGLLDLYKKEKERNALLLANNNGYFELKKYIKNNYISKDKIRKYLNSLKYWEDNNTSFLESKGEIFLNKEFIINIFEDLLKES